MLNKFDSSAAPHHLKCQHFLDPFSAQQPFLTYLHVPRCFTQADQLSLPELWKYCSPVFPKGVSHQYPKTLSYNLKLPFFGGGGVTVGEREGQQGWRTFPFRLLFFPQIIFHSKIQLPDAYFHTSVKRFLFLAPEECQEFYLRGFSNFFLRL